MILGCVIQTLALSSRTEIPSHASNSHPDGERRIKGASGLPRRDVVLLKGAIRKQLQAVGGT